MYGLKYHGCLLRRRAGYMGWNVLAACCAGELDVWEGMSWIFVAQESWIHEWECLGCLLHKRARCMGGNEAKYSGESR